jgi:ornithine carbamoyltransferase
MAQVRHFIDILDCDRQFLAGLIERAIAEKRQMRAGSLPPVLAGKSLAMYFEKPSLRTRLSFEVAMAQLGGHALYLTSEEVGLGRREPIKDFARVVSRMCDGIVVRTFSHEMVAELAEFASVPVINALTDYSHPCQAMADLMTIKEELGTLAGLKLAFVGDGNNVARSVASACGLLGVEFVLAAPPAYQLEEGFVNDLRRLASGAKFEQIEDPRQAVDQADIVYTDTWISMGQEKDRQERIKDFEGYQITSALMKLAKPSAIVLHCLPAYRGYEISDEVIESPQSLVFEEAENRLHLQRTLLSVLITGLEV